MKKILFILSMVCGLFVASCSCRHEVKKADFIDTLVADYEATLAQYDSVKVDLREVQCLLNEAVNSENELKVVQAVQIYQATPGNEEIPYVIFHEKNYESGLDTTTVVYGVWVGSGNFDPRELEYNFDQAVERLHEANIVLPEANFLTLRHPLTGGNFLNPLYIFGSVHTSLVAVDAMNGDVSLLVAEGLGESLIERPE